MNPGRPDASLVRILSRFDGDLGHFRSLVLEMGQRVVAQVTTASEALADCDIAKARQVIDERRAIRDLDIDSLEANARLYAIHQPVASDLRLVLTLSRAVYDLERISGEAVRLADIAQEIYEFQPSARERVIFQDVRRMARPAIDLLEKACRRWPMRRCRRRSRSQWTARNSRNSFAAHCAGWRPI